MTAEEYGNAYEQGFDVILRRLMARDLDHGRAEELAQAAWARGWERSLQLRDTRCVARWVAKIALNMLRDDQVSFKVTRQLRAEDELIAAQEIDLVAIDVRRMLKSCDARYRCVLQGTYVEGLSTSELARASRTTLRGIEGQLYRARLVLRQKMSARLVESELRGAKGGSFQKQYGQQH